jgi:two-component sensor histidine kinase
MSLRPTPRNTVAFGSESGQVSVRWAIDGDELHLSWTEAGGPVIAPPRTQGFGSRLVASTINGLGGSVDYEWAPAGLMATLRLPLASLRG